MNEDPRELAEADLLKRAAGGDGEAFAELMHRHQKLAQDTALRMLRDPDAVKDIVQTAFMRIHEQLVQGKTIQHFPAYLRITVSRLCQDRLDLKTPTPAGDLPDVPAAGSTMSSMAAAHEVRSRVRGLMAELGDNQRRAIHLKYDQGLSTQEIADLMKLTPKAVERLLARGRRAVEAKLRSPGEKSDP